MPHPPTSFVPTGLPKAPSSRAVFLLWQGSHRDCQLTSSQNRSWSPLCGLIWSTTLAALMVPILRHSAHNGLLRRYKSLQCFHLLPYPRCLDMVGLSFPSFCSFLQGKDVSSLSPWGFVLAMACPVSQVAGAVQMPAATVRATCHHQVDAIPETPGNRGLSIVVFHI